ncbi:MAG: hypothetical protein LBO82_10460 [Synergistaceae bacterium]|jgi:hypothetical protein|nr:hypothetical protein [Synergistaceae bacterium]
MLVKGCKKAALVWVMVILSVSAARAAPKDSALVGGKGDADFSQYTKTIPGRIEVTYNGLWKHGNVLEAYYTITSKEDRKLSIEAANSVLRDANDVEITLRLPQAQRPLSSRWHYSKDGQFPLGEVTVAELLQSVGAGAYIYKDKIEKDKDGKDKVKDTEEIAANQPYRVTVRYWAESDYVLTSTFKLVTVVVNGLPVEFKDITVIP